MNILKLLMVGLMLSFTQWANAQNGIMDISVVPLVPDTVAPAGMIDVAFEIKVQQPQNVQKLFFFVGMNQDDGSIFTDSVQIVPDSIGYGTLYNTKQFPIENYQARWIFRLSDVQWDQYAFITVYGRLSDATETTRLYWQKVTQ